MKTTHLLLIIVITAVVSASIAITAVILIDRPRRAAEKTTETLPLQNKATLIPILQKSLADNPPTKNERWTFGPQSNEETIIRHPVPVGNGELNEDGSLAMASDNEYHTLYRSSQLVNLHIFDPKDELSSEQILKIWRIRLHGIIPEAEINVAESALKMARGKLATTYNTFRNDQPTEDEDRPLAECFGQIYETRITTLSQRAVSIDLVWINRRNVIQ